MVDKSASQPAEDIHTTGEEEATMKTGFILAIQTTLAIGAIMVMLEIMLTMASPLAVELEVDELERTMQTKGFILAILTTLVIGATMPILEIMLMKASPLAVETKVFLQAQVSLLVFQASCQKVLATRATFNLSYYSGKLIEFHQV